MVAFRRSLQRLLPDELWSLIQAQSRLSFPLRPAITNNNNQQRVLASSSVASFSTFKPHFNQHETTPGSANSTVDPTELSHFATLASSWWDPNGPSRLLHLMNELRHTFISSCLSSQATAPPSQLHYLDIGCGGGIFAESAARLSHTGSVTAIDPSPAVLSVAKAHARQDPLLVQPGRLTYINTSIEKLAESSECRESGYDIVTIFEVLEHVSAPSTFLGSVLPHVKPGGWIVLSTIARTWTSWFVTKVMAEDVLRFVPRGTHDWRKYVNEMELREWFEKRNGWGNPRTMGVLYVPGLGWREVKGSESVGNYFFAIRKDPE